MNSHRRRDGEIRELARLLPVPAERDLPAGRAQTIKEHLMTELRTREGSVPVPRHAGRAPARRPRARRMILVAATGAGVLGLAAVALVLTIQPAHRTASPGAPTAAQLLARIADAAARQANPAVGDNQYEYVKVTVRTAGEKEHFIRDKQGNVIGNYFTPTGTYSQAQTETWSPVADVCRDGMSRSATGQEERFTAKGPGVKCPDSGGLNDPTYRLLQSLPTDPRTLLNLINTEEKGHGPGPAAEAFTTIGDLMRGQVVPPQVSAALFRAAALIPGVTVVPDAMDVAGRPGVAVAFDSHSRLANGRSENVRQEWVFNQSTLQFMGEGTVADGIVTSASAVLDRGFVDRLGEVPAGTRKR
jgi:hypothetical protein